MVAEAGFLDEECPRLFSGHRRERRRQQQQYGERSEHFGWLRLHDEDFGWMEMALMVVSRVGVGESVQHVYLIFRACSRLSGRGR